MPAHASTLKRIALVRQIVAESYEPGRQDRNKTWVWRTRVRPLLGISLRTFSRYLGAPAADPPPGAGRQLSLFPGAGREGVDGREGEGQLVGLPQPGQVV